MGGASARFNLINKIRISNEHVLLFDSGDIMQGTPYFNYFNGEVELFSRALLSIIYKDNRKNEKSSYGINNW